MISNGHPALSLVAVGALSLAAACARPPQPPVPSGAPGFQCPTGYAVMVTNNTARPVDIWESVRGEWVYLATVSARATNDLPLTGDGPVKWLWPPEPPRYDPNLSMDFTLHLHCR